ncbi:MAG TPA: DeoR/GlpR family DNA-binding transcription regulator [Candidatus Binatia bacterium]|nr:DeoR/GlpR family DNA-binding transcription regulator [Candidatus Binatia bacterium]
MVQGAVKVSKKERQDGILNELRRCPTMRISELAQLFDVSNETIRRDLEELGQSGLINRTYGGAIAARPLGLEAGWSERYNKMSRERERIALKAVRLIQPGEVVMIDSGATTLHFARRLANELKDVTVITNSYAIAMAVANNPSMTVVSCPGTFDRHEGCVVGADTANFLTRFNANRVVIGASGVTREGPNEAHLGSAAVKRVMLERAQSRILLVDHSKFNQTNLDVVCPLGGIDYMVTDQAPTGELAAALQRARVEVQESAVD